MKIKGILKRISAFTITAAMVTSMVCGGNITTVKAETNGTPAENTNSLGKLGFDTSKAQNQLNDTVSGGTLPLGGSTNKEVQVTSMMTVSEAGIASAVYPMSLSKNSNQIIDNLEPAKTDTTNSGDLNNQGTYIGNGTDTVYTTSSGDQAVGSIHTSCVAFDGDGNGKDDQMVQLDLRNKNTKADPIYRIQLRYFTYSSSDKNWTLKKTISSISSLPFNIRPTQAYGYLSMVAGDYDGDGRDEMAIYHPNDDSHISKIKIYEVNSAGEFVETNKSFSLWECCSIDNYKMFTVGDNESNTNLKKNVPVVNLEAISQPTDVYDDLAVTASHPNESEYLKDDYDGDKTECVLNSMSTVGIIVDPMSSNSDLWELDMKWNWKSNMGITTSESESKYEIMRFAGASAGNVDGDDATELFVAGYRINNPKGSDYGLDEKTYLYTTIEYNPSTKSYSKSKPSWIGLEETYNNGASSMNENAISNDFSNDENFVLSPMAIEAYAERGIGYPESIFVNGYVMAQDLSQDVISFQTNAGMTYSSNYQGIADIGEYFASNNRFLLRYAIPVERFGIESGEQRGYMQAVSANFNGNSKGIESLLFSYAKNANVLSSSNPGRAEYRYIVGMINNPDGNDKVANISNKKIDGVYYSWMYASDKSKGNAMCYYDYGSMSVSVYTCDVDDDSTLVRPRLDSNGKYITPEIKFKDPQILAVLQAQPYFEELEYDSSGGGTTFTKSTSSGTTDGNSTSFDLSVGIGFEFELSTGVKFGVSEVLGYTFGREEEWEIEESVSLDTSFGTDGKDSVVLAMTPEICYFYEAWDINTKKWLPMSIKVPQGSQTTQISVDRYDMVAKASGWDMIRGNILFNEAGDPTTYAKSSTGLKDFTAASNTIGKNDFLTTGSGSGQSTTSITVERNESHTCSYTNGANSETEVTIASVKGTFSIGGSHTETSGTFTTEGSSYEGEVADLPDEDFVFDNYRFDWLFGFWTGELEGCTFPVLGYIVKNVSSAPKMPQELHVGEMTENSATLCWTSDYTVGFYVIESYIESADEYVRVGTVSAGNSANGKYEYILNDLEPDSNYSFRVIYYQMDGAIIRASLPTEPVDVKTYSANDNAPFFIEQPNDAEVNAGDNAVFKVNVSSESTGKIYYTWQRYSSKGWSNISGATGQKLEIKSVSAEQNREMYRCRVIQGSTTIYSSSAILSVVRKNPEISISVIDAELKASVICDGMPIDSEADILFETINEDTGSSKVYAAKTGSDGSAKITWTPEEAGNYKICVQLIEDEVYNSAVSTLFMFVKPVETILSLGGVSNLIYGETLVLTPKLYTENSDLGIDVNPTYNIYRISDSKSVLVASSQSSSSIPVISGNTYKPLMAGTYKLEAVYNEYKAVKIFTVEKRDVTVSADISTNIPEVNVSGAEISDVNPIKNLYEIKADGYDTIPSTVGIYTLYPKVKADKTISADYLSKYDFYEESTLLEKAAPTHTLNMQSVGRGNVFGTFYLEQIDEEMTVPDDNEVVEGAKVTISARPEKGYKINKWVINGNDLMKSGKLVTNDTYVINSMNANTDVKVEFIEKSHIVSFEAQENGSISAHYYNLASNTIGTEFLSGNQIVSDECLQLKVIPQEGYIVEKWTIDNGSGVETIIRDSFGVAYTGKEYILDKVNANTTVKVYFVKTQGSLIDYSKMIEEMQNELETLKQYTEDTIEQLKTSMEQADADMYLYIDESIDELFNSLDQLRTSLEQADTDIGESIDELAQSLEQIKLSLEQADIDAGLYIDRSIEELTQLLKEVKTSLEQADTDTKLYIDESVEGLLKTIEQLRKSLEQSDADLSIYTEKSVEQLKTAFDQLNESLAQMGNKMDITEQNIIVKYTEAIEVAIKGLEIKRADYSAVNEAIKRIPENLEKYDINTVIDLFTARMNIKYELPITMQDEVNSYAVMLNKAIDGLKEISEDKAPQTPEIKVGMKFVSGNNLYVITKHSEKRHEVQFVGVVKSKSSVKIPNQVNYKKVKFKVTSIKNKALHNDRKIKALSIGNYVRKIGDYAFYKAKLLKKVTIGTGLVSIGKHSFCHNKKDSIMIIKSKKLTKVASPQCHPTGKRVIKVPSKKLKAYKRLFKRDKETKIKKI